VEGTQDLLENLQKKVAITKLSIFELQCLTTICCHAYIVLVLIIYYLEICIALFLKYKFVVDIIIDLCDQSTILMYGKAET